MKYRLISHLAWKTFLSNKSQFWLSIFGYALSVLVFVFVMMLTLQWQQSVDSVLTSTGTHFIAFKPQCCSNPYFSDERAEGFVAQGIASQPLAASLIDSLNALASVSNASPFLAYRLAEADGPVMIGGFDPDNHISVPTTCCAARDITEGRFLEPDDVGMVLVEQAFAVARGIRSGTSLHLKGREFRVIGIVNPGVRPAKTDVYMKLADARHLIESFSGVMADELMNIALVESASAAAHRQALKDVERCLGQAGLVSTYGCYKPASKAMDFHHRFLKVMAVFVLIFAVLTAFKTQRDSLLARKRDLGVLCAMGWSRLNLGFMVVLESIIQSVIGGFLGGALTLLILAWQSIPASTWHWFVIALGLVVAGGCVAGFIPAWLLTRKLPIAHLR